MRRLLKLANPKNPCTNLISYGVGYSYIAYIFLGLIRTPLVVTINPKNSTKVL